MEFGDRLRARRLELGWTVKEAAKALGISDRYQKMLEAGERQPSVELTRMAREVMHDRWMPVKSKFGWWVPGESREEHPVDTQPKEWPDPPRNRLDVPPVDRKQPEPEGPTLTDFQRRWRIAQWRTERRLMAEGLRRAEAVQSRPRGPGRMPYGR